MYISESSLFFLSEKNKQTQNKLPSISNQYVKNNSLLEQKTPRVVLYPTVEAALITEGIDLTGKELYIYTVESSDVKFYQPKTELQKHTYEVWTEDVVKLTCVGKLKVTGQNDSSLMIESVNVYKSLCTHSFEVVESEYGIPNGDGLKTRENLRIDTIYEFVFESGYSTLWSQDEKESLFNILLEATSAEENLSASLNELNIIKEKQAAARALYKKYNKISLNGADTLEDDKWFNSQSPVKLANDDTVLSTKLRDAKLRYTLAKAQADTERKQIAKDEKKNEPKKPSVIKTAITKIMKPGQREVYEFVNDVFVELCEEPLNDTLIDTLFHSIYSEYTNDKIPVSYEMLFEDVVTELSYTEVKDNDMKASSINYLEGKLRLLNTQAPALSDFKTRVQYINAKSEWTAKVNALKEKINYVKYGEVNKSAVSEDVVATEASKTFLKTNSFYGKDTVYLTGLVKTLTQFTIENDQQGVQRVYRELSMKVNNQTPAEILTSIYQSTLMRCEKSLQTLIDFSEKEQINTTKQQTLIQKFQHNLGSVVVK